MLSPFQKKKEIIWLSEFHFLPPNYTFVTLITHRVKIRLEYPF